MRIIENDKVFGFFIGTLTAWLIIAFIGFAIYSAKQRRWVHWTDVIYGEKFIYDSKLYQCKEVGKYIYYDKKSDK